MMASFEARCYVQDLTLKGLPLFTRLPRRLILGNLHSYTRIPIRYRGVGKRDCSTSFLEEFFSETRPLISTSLAEASPLLDASGLNLCKHKAVGVLPTWESARKEEAPTYGCWCLYGISRRHMGAV